ncbi:MAG: DUF86 domain-containing protein [Actinobacteria bacterium]|nr:DUF86 domain-containing protein [Actinomycetota bacterium]
MAVTFRDRIAHMKDAIAHIRSLRAKASDTRIRHDPVLRAALERFFEIISEASRHIPEDRRAAYPDIPWKRIAGIGNVLRHAYDGVDIDLLLNTAGPELDALERAVSQLLDAPE